MDIELNTPRQIRDANVQLPGGEFITIPSYQLTPESMQKFLARVAEYQSLTIGADNTPIGPAGELLVHWETDENGFLYVGATRMVVR